MIEPNNPPSESARVAFDPTIKFSERVVGRRTMVIAHHPALGKFYQLGPEEHHIARLMDGSRSFGEIVEQLERDGIGWDPADLAELITRFITSGLASPVIPTPTTPTAPNPGGGSTVPVPWTSRLPQMLSLTLSQRIPLFNGDAVAASLEKRIGFVFSGTGTLLWCLLVISGLTIVAADHQAFGQELRRMFDSNLWIALLAMWVVAKVIHEAGHSVAAKYHGVHVGNVGIMFFFLAPLAYVDVTDAWKLKSRWSRVQIALAGVYLELATAAIAAWAWWCLPDGMTRHFAAQFFLVSGPATLLVNANPLLRLDGYYVVSDLAEIPNLRMHGRSQLVGWLEWLLMKIPMPRPLLSGWRRSFATTHAACSVVFQVIWMGGLIVGVTMWAKGLGIGLALSALTLWVILPLTKWLYKIWMYQLESHRYLTDQRRRLIGLISMVFFLLPYVSLMQSPLARRVPVVVQFRDEQIARAATAAFVQNVYVARGQRVEAGMLLVELENPELKIQRDQKSDDLKIAELRAIQYRRQGELSKSATESANAASLRRQLVELDIQIASLHLVARRAGLVVGAGIDSLEGRFVDQGDELLRVCDPQEKELLAAVGETDVEAYQTAALREATSQIRLRGGTTFTAIPSKLRPRARRTLPHPALAATVGGPLAVEPTTEDGQSIRVVEPQMESITPLGALTSSEIHAGQIGTMTIDDNRSLVARLIDVMKR